jgi:hypothetical protein
MKYAIIVWTKDSEIFNGTGDVYGWYESLATATNTAVNIVQNGSFAKAVVVKVL